MPGVFVGRKKRRGIRLRQQFTAGLAAAVRIVATQGFVFAVRPQPFLVCVDLVGGHQHAGTHTADLSNRFEQVERAHDVAGIGAQRIAITFTHQRLSGQVQDDLRLGFGDDLQQGTEIPQIAALIVDAFVDTRQFEQARPG
ncbi:hypothetical protein D9M71_753400 [compost metagenome]